MNEALKIDDWGANDPVVDWGVDDPVADQSTIGGDFQAGVKTAQTAIPGLRVGRGVGLIEDAQAGPTSVGGMNRDAELLRQEAAALRAEIPKLSGDEALAAREEVARLEAQAGQLGTLATTPSATANQERLDERAVAGVGILARNIPRIMELQGEASAIPLNPSAEAFVSPEGDTTREQLGAMWDALADDPYGVTRTFVVRSLPASTPSIIASVVGQAMGGPQGAAALAALVGGGTELGISMADGVGSALAEAGVNPNDPAALEKWISENPEEMFGILAKARSRAAAIGTGTAASAGATGTIARTAAQAGTPIRGEIAGAVVGGIAEGSTEAMAQVASGEGVSLGEIGAEVVGGVGTTMPEVAGQIAIETARRNRGEVSADQAAALTAGTTAPKVTPETEEERGKPAASEVSPDVAAALARDTLSGMRGTPQPGQDPNAPTPAPATPPAAQPAPEPSPAAPAGEVTGQGNEEGAPTPEAGIEPETIPEAPETLEIQAANLKDPGNRRKAMFIPNSSFEMGPVTEPEGRTIRRVVVDEGVIYVNTAKGYTVPDVRQLYKSGRLGTVLGLGEFNKADVAASAAAGNPEVAVTERTPEGVEVKAAAGTTETAPDQLAALQADATPGNTVQTEDPAAVIGGRVSAQPANALRTPEDLIAALDEQARRNQPPPAPMAAPAPIPSEPAPAQPAPAQAEAQPVEPAEAAETPAQRAARIRDEAITALAPQFEAMGTTADAVRAMPAARQRVVIDRAKREMGAASPAKATEKSPLEPKKPQPTKPETEPGLKVTQPGKAAPEQAPAAEGPRVFTAPVSEEVRQATERFNQGIRDNLGAQKAKEVSKARATERKEKLGGERNERLDAVKAEIKEGKYDSPEAEAEALARAGGKALTKKEIADKRKNAKIAADLLALWPDTFDTVTTPDDKLNLATRLNELVSVAENRGFQFKKTYPTDTDAVVWLNDARTLARQLSNPRTTYAQINKRLSDWGALKRGTGESLRETRKEEGDAAKKRTGSVDGIAAPSDPSTSVEATVDTESLAEREDATAEQDVQTLVEEPDADVGAKVTGSRRQVGSMFNEETAAEVTSEGKVLNADEKEAAKQELLKKYKDAADIFKAARRDDGASPNTPEDDAAFFAALTEEQTKFVDLAIDASIRSGRSWADLPATEIKAIYKQMGWPTDFNPASLWAVETVTLREASEIVKTDDLVAAVKERYLSEQDGEVQSRIAPMLLDAILDSVGDTKVHVIPDNAFGFFVDGNPFGYYSGLGDVIVMPERTTGDPAELVNTVVHEGGHAAMLAALRQSPRARQRVQTLMDIVQTKLEADGEDTSGRNAFRDVDEFMSEAWGSGTFQQQLAMVPISPAQLKKLNIPPFRAKIKNAFDVIKAELARIMGIEGWVKDMRRMGGQSAFDTALDIAGSLIEAAPYARASFKQEITKAIARPRDNAAAGDAPKKPKRETLKVHTLEKRLEWRGLNGETAKQVADMIRAEFEGKASNTELDAIVERITGEAPKVLQAAQKSARQTGTYHTRTITQIRKDGERLADQAMEMAEKDFVPGKNPGNPRLLNLLSNYQIGEVADRFFGEKNPVRQIAELIERRRVLKSRKLEQLTPTVEKLLAAKGKHTPQQWEEFTSLAHDATMANVHPDRSLEANKHLGKNRLNTKWNKAQHAKLAARYNALPQELKDLYAETRDTLTEAENLKVQAMVRNLLTAVGINDPAVAQRFFERKATEADKELVGTELAGHLERATELQKIEGPYFNLTRRGKYVVQGTYDIKAPSTATKLGDNVFEFTDKKAAIAFIEAQELHTTVQSVWVDKKTGETTVVDDDGTEVKISKQDTDAENRWRVKVQNQHVEFVDSRGQAMARQNELRKDGLKVRDIEPVRYQRQAQNAEMLSDQYRTMASTVEKRLASSNLTKGQQEELRQTLNEIALRFLGSTRIQSTQMRRSYVEGASTELIRNTFDYVDRTAGYLAKMDTAPALEKALLEMERRIKVIGAEETGSAEGARRIAEVMERRVYRKLPDEDEGYINNAITRYTNIAFIDALASPAYSLINATQVGMFTMPVLSADFNPVSAGYQLQRAYRELGAVNMWASGVADTGRALTGKQVTANHFVDDVKARLKEPRERDMIDELVAVGLVDADAGMETSRVLSRDPGPALSKIRSAEDAKRAALGKFDFALQKVDNLVRALPQSVEAVNRTTTALAAYRMMYNRTKDHEKSLRYAKDVVNDTQALMSNSNSAPIFSHPIGRISLQFKKFGQMAYYLLGKNVGRVFNPQNKGERAQGLTTLAYISATHATMAGVMGLPGLEAFKIALMLFNGFGATDMEWEDYEEEVRKQTEALLGERGADMVTFGVTRGIPGGWGFDLNSRLGMDSLLIFGEPRGDTQSDWKAFMFDQLAGPFGRTAWDAGKGALAAAQGDPTQAHRMIPFKALADVGMAISKGAEGKMDTQDMILRSIGLMSDRQAGISRQIGSEIRGRRRENEERDGLVREYLRVRKPEDRRAVLIRIQKFNRMAARNGQRPITTKGLDEIRARERARYRE